MRRYLLLGYYTHNGDKIYSNYILIDTEFNYNFIINPKFFNKEKYDSQLKLYLKYNVKFYTYDSILKYLNSNDEKDLIADNYFIFKDIKSN